MMSRGFSQILLYGVALATWACLPLGAIAQNGASGAPPATVEGKTRPSERAELSFYGPGIIKENPVKEGDRIKAGQLLMAQDDRIERKLMEQLQLEASTTLPREAAEAELAARKVELARVEQMYEKKVSSQLELDRAKVEALIADLKVKAASEESAQKKLEAQRQEIKVDLMRLLSPIDGVVLKVDDFAGEVIDPSKPSITIVKNDPLFVEAYVPTAYSGSMTVGQKMDVRYETEDEWTAAEVISFSPVISAANTQLVRMKLPNPSNRAAGFLVQVKLPEKVEAGTAAQVAP